MITLILGIATGLLLIISIVEFFIIRGVLKVEPELGEEKYLTGREIEEIRRKVVAVGKQTITVGEILNIIRTIRDTHLGTYIDEDPYFPADPYDDIDGRRT